MQLIRNGLLAAAIHTQADVLTCALLLLFCTLLTLLLTTLPGRKTVAGRDQAGTRQHVGNCASLSGIPQRRASLL